MITANVRADLEILSIAPTTPEIYHELCRLNEAGLMHQCDQTHWIRSGRGTARLGFGKRPEKTEHTDFYYVTICPCQQ